MRTSRLLSFLLAITVVASVRAAGEDDQILVFRNSGAVEIFSTSTLKSIENSFTDSEGQTHDRIIAQRFVTADTIMVIPVAEIDSVTFGSRNGIIPKKGVWHIEESHLQYITSFDGEKILYSPSAPSAVIPPAGVKIYSDTFSEHFPYGFCGETLSRSQGSDGTAIAVNELAPAEVFDYLFFASLGGDEMVIPLPSRANGNIEHQLQIEQDNVSIKAGVQCNVNITNKVFNPLRGYCHAKIETSLVLGTDMEIEAKESAEWHPESPSITIFTLAGGWLQSHLDVSLFADIAASLKLASQFRYGLSASYDWTYQDGKHSFERVDDTSEDEPDIEPFSAQVVLSGELFGGILSRLYLHPLFDRVGAYVQNKSGIKFSGELGFSTLDQLASENTPGVVPEFSLSMSALTRLDTYAYYHRLLFGEREEIQLPFSFELTFFERELDLLPYLSSRATTARIPAAMGEPMAAGSNGVEAVSSTVTPLAAPLTLGYDIVNNEGETVVATVDKAGEIEAMSNEPQCVVAEVPVSSVAEKAEELKVRPFVNYAERKIPFPLCSVSDGQYLFPTFTSAAASGAYLIGGAPIIGQYSTESNVGIIGNYMPVSVVVPGLKKKPHRSEALVDANKILGGWSGEGVSITFNDDGSVNYNGRKGTFRHNYPQMGMCTLFFSNGTTLGISVNSVTASEMGITFPPYTKQITLKK